MSSSPNEKVKNRILILKRCGSTILSFMGFLSSLLAFYEFVLNEENKVNIFVLCLIIIFILGFGAYTISRFITYRKEAESAMSIFTDSLHQINHLMRDSLFNLDTITRGETSKQIISALYFSGLKEAIEIMSNTLCGFSDNKICISVSEIFCSGEVGTAQNTFVHTICMSSNTQHSRVRRRRAHKVSENTDYRMILSGELDSFSVSNLKKYMRNNEYCNSRKYWEKNYNAIIVVPIRIENDNLGVKNGYKYDIIGFVCADTKAKKVFTDKNIEDYTNYIRGCADIFYIYLKQYERALKAL